MKRDQLFVEIDITDINQITKEAVVSVISNKRLIFLTERHQASSVVTIPVLNLYYIESMNDETRKLTASSTNRRNLKFEVSYDFLKGCLVGNSPDDFEEIKLEYSVVFNIYSNLVILDDDQSYVVIEGTEPKCVLKNTMTGEIVTLTLDEWTRIKKLLIARQRL